MSTIIIIIVQYNNDTMLHSLYLKRIFLEKSSNKSQGSFGFMQSNFPWYVPSGHYKSKLCSLWVNLIKNMCCVYQPRLTQRTTSLTLKAGGKCSYGIN